MSFLDEMSGRDWILVLTGGLAGAALNQLANFIVYLLSRPILKLTFRPSVPGCEVNTPAYLLDENGYVALDASQIRALQALLTLDQLSFYL
jgi:hypothetical protein